MIPYIEKFDADTYWQDQINWIGDFLSFLATKEKTGNTTLVDIGANLGSITDRMIQAQVSDDYDIICVEPHPVLFDQLTEKYRNNPRLRVLPFVMNDVVQDNIDFNYSLDHPGSSHVKFTPGDVKASYQTVTRQAVSIDHLCREFRHRCSFIKIDAEGHDFLILRGAEKLLSTDRPVVLFEFSGLMACKQYDYTPLQWYQFFQHMGYRLLSPIGCHEEKFILKNYDNFCPDLIDLLAIPTEKYVKLVS